MSIHQSGVIATRRRKLLEPFHSTSLETTIVAGRYAFAEGACLIIYANLRKKESGWRSGEGKNALAADDKVVVVVLAISTVFRFLPLDARTIFRGEQFRIGLRPKLCGIRVRLVTHERQLGHAGDGSRIVRFQSRPELDDKGIEFRLQGRRRGGFFGACASASAGLVRTDARTILNSMLIVVKTPAECG